MLKGPLAASSAEEWSLNTSSVNQSSVSELGSLTVHKSKKYLRARRPSPLWTTVETDVMSIVKISLSLPRKLKHMC